MRESARKYLLLLVLVRLLGLLETISRTGLIGSRNLAGLGHRIVAIAWHCAHGLNRRIEHSVHPLAVVAQQYGHKDKRQRVATPPKGLANRAERPISTEAIAER